MLSSGMVCGGKYNVSGSIPRTIPCDFNFPSLSIPVNNVTLPLWPLPFHLLAFSGKKQINIKYHKQTLILFLSSNSLETS